MVNLRPFRDYDEKDVINLFALDTSLLDTAITTWDTRVPAGSLVELSTAGWHYDDEIFDIGTQVAAGDYSVNNVTSDRWGVNAKVQLCEQGQSGVLGMMLNHVALVDENGEQLKYSPRKASELETVLPWQAVPVVRRGIFLVQSDSLTAQTFNAGATLTAHRTGGNDGDFDAGAPSSGETLVGYALGNNNLTPGHADHHTSHLILLDIGAPATSGVTSA